MRVNQIRNALRNLTLSGVALFSFHSGELKASSVDDLFSLNLEALLSIPVTSSTLTEHNQKTVPSSVTVFNQSQIQSMGLDYLHELMNFVPGFQSFRQEEAGNEYYHSSRGSRSSTSSREVLILVDGVRLNREFDNATAVPMLPLNMIEKVEFIRGPGSALYGSNAFLGVIDISLRKAQNNLYSSVGGQGFVQNHVSFSHDWAGYNINALLGLSKDDGRALVLEQPNTAELVSSEDPSRAIDLNLTVTRDAHQVNIMHFEHEQKGFYLLGDVDNQFNETNNRFSSAHYQLKQRWQNEIETSYRARVFRETYDIIGTKPFLGLSSAKQSSDGFELGVRNQLSINGQNQFLFGLDYRKVEIQESILSSQFVGTDLFNEEISREIFGAYAQNQWQIHQDLELTVGARWDDYSGIGSSLSPRVGITYQVNEFNTLKLLYGEAFRAPTTNETDILDVFGFGQLEGNSELSPETISTLELVWRYEEERHALNVTVFENIVKDAIFRDNTQTPPTFFNADGEHSWQGLEVEMQAKLPLNFSISGNVSFIKNLAKADEEQASRLASLIIDYQRAQWRWNISANFAGKRAFLSGTEQVTLDRYQLFNSKLQYQAADKVSLYVQAKNLLDKDYLSPFEDDTYTLGIPNRGREWSVGAKVEFN